MEVLAASSIGLKQMSLQRDARRMQWRLVLQQSHLQRRLEVNLRCYAACVVQILSNVTSSATVIALQRWRFIP